MSCNKRIKFILPKSFLGLYPKTKMMSFGMGVSVSTWGLSIF
jgi:hypothetical protein